MATPRAGTPVQRIRAKRAAAGLCQCGGTRPCERKHRPKPGMAGGGAVTILRRDCRCWHGEHRFHITVAPWVRARCSCEDCRVFRRETTKLKANRKRAYRAATRRSKLIAAIRERGLFVLEEHLLRSVPGIGRGLTLAQDLQELERSGVLADEHGADGQHLAGA